MWFMVPLSVIAQEYTCLTLPNQDLLSSNRVLYMMEDSEGYLWYATEGGGICRDDGRQLKVFHNDAEHQNLLGSNDVGCLAEIGHLIIIGTFHGAYILDKRDYTIKQITQVDEKRIDDILVSHENRIFLTANKKIYEFSYATENIDMPLILKSTYPSRWKGRDCYVSHLYQDKNDRIWATQWGGGLLQKEGNVFKEVKWPLNCAPSDVAEDPHTDCLWVGTIGQGIVKYNPKDGTVEHQQETDESICIDLQLSIDKKHLWMTTIDNLSLFHIDDHLSQIPTDNFLPKGELVLNRMSQNRHGQLFVAGSKPSAFVIGQSTLQWYTDVIVDGDLIWEYRERQGVVAIDNHTKQEYHVNYSGLPLQPTITKCEDGGIWATDGERILWCSPDSIYKIADVFPRPAAMVDNGHGELFLATENEIKRLDIKAKQIKTLIPNVPDVSALSFTPDGTLWLGTIYGRLYNYRNGKLDIDEYASNEYGDGITNLLVDSLGRLLIAYDRYVRLYDTQRHTLRQQSRTASDVYSIELQETAPNKHWSHPRQDQVIERLPKWVTSWWMGCIYVVLLLFVVMLLTYIYLLHRQRRRFITMIKGSTPNTTDDIVFAEAKQEYTKEEGEEEITLQQDTEDELLQKAITLVEKNLGNDKYTVEMLSADLCMSRMTFYRKILSHTGQKPTEFIRTIRLRHAAELLREGQLSVTEISYATGFSSVSYFSRCFRTMYGVPPTQYN